MNPLSITRAASFTTSDGKTFDTRPKAVEHEKSLQRLSNLQRLFGGDGYESLTLQEVVLHADAIIKAIDVKQARSPNKPKVAA
jgi:hypothetical protein